MNLRRKQIVTVSDEYKGLAFTPGQKVKFLGTNNTGHKFQALNRENGNPRKEDWLNENEIER